MKEMSRFIKERSVPLVKVVDEPLFNEHESIVSWCVCVPGAPAPVVMGWLDDDDDHTAEGVQSIINEAMVYSMEHNYRIEVKVDVKDYDNE